MSSLLVFAAVALLLSLLLGLLRIWRGPSAADRMLAAQLFGTTGVAILLLLAVITESNAVFDIALVFSLLAAVAMLAFIRRTNLTPPANNKDAQS